MEAKEIREKSIVEYLSSLGIKPVRETGFSYVYMSPFRGESFPSFHVRKKNGKWKDFGNDLGGNIIDLVMSLKNVDFKEAMNILGNDQVISLPEYEKPIKPPTEGIQIVSVNEIHSESLIQYVESRGMPIDLCRRHCSQIEFRFPHGKRPGRINSAIGFKNDSGGWELRSSFWKVSNSPKDIKTIKGVENTTMIFEGFFDLLSAYVFFKKEKFKSDVIVLNSLGYITTLIPILKEADNNFLFIDNGKAANEKIEKLREEGVNLEDCRHYFSGHGDMNEFLVANNCGINKK